MKCFDKQCERCYKNKGSTQYENTIVNCIHKLYLRIKLKHHCITCERFACDIGYVGGYLYNVPPYLCVLNITVSILICEVCVHVVCVWEIERVHESEWKNERVSEHTFARERERE